MRKAIVQLTRPHLLRVLVYALAVFSPALGVAHWAGMALRAVPISCSALALVLACYFLAPRLRHDETQDLQHPLGTQEIAKLVLGWFVLGVATCFTEIYLHGAAGEDGFLKLLAIPGAAFPLGLAFSMARHRS